MRSNSSIIFTSALFFLIFLLALSTVSAYPEMLENLNTANSSNSLEVIPTSSYGTDIVMMQHLIEIDQVSYEDYTKIAETLVIRNAGTENYTGPIYTWIPDEAFDVTLALLEMAMSGQINLIDYSMEGEVASWNGTVLAGPNMPLMYRLEYKLPKGSTDKISVTKKLKYPTLVNYDYMPPQSMPALVIKVMVPEDMETSFNSGVGNKIEADSVEILENSKTYNWAIPLFEEITVESEKSAAGSADITLYLLIALVIILIIGYSFFRGKSTTIKNFEEKLTAVMPKKQDDDIYLDKEDDEDDDYADDEDEYEDDEYVDDEDEYEDDEELDEEEDAGRNGKTSSTRSVLEVADIKDLDLDQLKSAKKSILNILMELDEDYSNGNLLEEEYNSIRSEHQDKVIEIMRQIDALEE